MAPRRRSRAVVRTRSDRTGSTRLERQAGVPEVVVLPGLLGGWVVLKPSVSRNGSDTRDPQPRPAARRFAEPRRGNPRANVPATEIGQGTGYRAHTSLTSVDAIVPHAQCHAL